MEQALIVEDLPEAKCLLERVVHAAFPNCIYHSYSNVFDSLRAIDANRYNLALIDIQLPDGSGFEILKRITQLHPETVCVITTILADDDTIIAALSLGAQGYLLKEQPLEIQARQLGQLSDGIPALSPPIARRILQHFQQDHQVETPPPKHNLTPREEEVLAHIARGLRLHEVAARLDLSENTIASYVKTIYRKLNISSRAEAAICSKQFGLI